MQQLTVYLMRSLMAAAALALLMPSAHAQTPAKTANSKSVARNDNGVTLNFNNSEISDVAIIIGTLMEKNVVIDPKVKGSMTLRSITPVTPGEAFVLFSAQLRAQGFAIIEVDGVYTVLPEAEAKLRTGKTTSGPLRKSDGGQVLTRIFKLEHESANALVPILRPLISPNNTINAVPNSNALVITDYADNLNRLARIIASLDKDSYGALEVIRLTHALAVEIAPLVREVIDAASVPAGRQKKTSMYSPFWWLMHGPTPY